MKRLVLLASALLFFVGVSAQNKKYDPPTKITELLQKNGCYTCHKSEKKMIGPSYLEISKKGYSDDKIVQLIWKPENNWKSAGYPPMVGLPQVPKAEGLKIAKWVNSLKSL
jgi:cytochrome c